MNDEIINNINQRLDKAIDKGRDIVTDDELLARIDDLKERAEALVREHPIKSVVIGFSIGFLLSRLFGSDDD